MVKCILLFSCVILSSGCASSAANQQWTGAAVTSSTPSEISADTVVNAEAVDLPPLPATDRTNDFPKVFDSNQP